MSDAQTTPQMNAGDMFERFRLATARGDVAFALGLIGIIVILIFPMPRILMDVFLAISITLSVMVLMTVLFIEKPLELSSFPTMLLVTTMLRLALNVASTRLILSDGHEGTEAAGHVIEAFGGFIMSGNFVIGIIIFSILVIVNFVVITKGSGRIAEVSARFSLDAMPGKQMAIDADLSAGLIDEPTARKRRKTLEDESNFYGAMDGAAKFVRGDAIAGILITLINLIGGILIGMVQKSLTFEQASHTYTILTVGDGLVSQVPALIISTAAGMLVSKSGVEGSTDKAFIGQLTAYPSALGMSSVLTTALALLPGIPMLPFLMISIATGVTAWRLSETQEAGAKQENKGEQSSDKGVQPDLEKPVTASLKMDIVRIELGYNLLKVAEGDTGTKLTDQIRAMRHKLAGDYGFVLPTVRIQDNINLDANSYTIAIKEIPVGNGQLNPAKVLAIDPQGRDIPYPGEFVKEPAFGMPAKWIQPDKKDEAEADGFMVIDPTTVITTHLSEIIKDNISDLLNYTDTQSLVDNLDEAHKKLLSEMVPTQISLGGIQRILQNLLHEKVSIRDLNLILEAISEVSGSTRNLVSITEHVRTRLARQICMGLSQNDTLGVIMLSNEWEKTFYDSLVVEGESKQLSLPPSKLQDFIESVKAYFDPVYLRGENPVLMTSPSVRPYVRSIIERFRPNIAVLSQNEIHPKMKLKNLGQLLIKAA